MSARKMVPGLAHKWAWSSDDTKFFAEIDRLGGWPAGFSHVGFSHTDEREAGFCNSPRNDGWWTVLASADDYYLWKLSPAAVQRIVDATLAAARITRVDAQSIRIMNSQGSRAVLAAPSTSMVGAA
jgi:hypothetical protein